MQDYWKGIHIYLKLLGKWTHQAKVLNLIIGWFKIKYILYFMSFISTNMRKVMNI